MSRTKEDQPRNKIVWVLFGILLFCSLFFECSLFPGAKAELPGQFTLASQGKIIYSLLHSSQNLAVVPECWGDYNGVEVFFNAGTQITHVETNPAHFHNGNISLRIDPHREGIDLNHARELDTKWTPVKPGDHIVFRCWMKTSSASNPANNGKPTYGGARIGIDFYGHTDVLGGGRPSEEERTYSYVPFGSDWTLKTWDFVVPDTWFETNNNWNSPDYGKPIVPQQIMGYIAWMQVTPVAEGVAWFADAELYINP